MEKNISKQIIDQKVNKQAARELEEYYQRLLDEIS